ncbi:hypothetical protein [Ilumatobacter coccineus]|jgi:hypothetical protein|uniref:Uncharacterized protein n=1 Tax=Ilumatobacter coccineus (strain NBRC 103263 / KCTC 29153 / YM16-304) TaxID=1313172 RepID=A0A6C7E9N1_ILUCY|nr:hypothetical protein [Ilumatobacter coccineus]BAN01318.1 hypothetical protein YM304_10040 [Ilumatobacter coccineus YM16-304]
MTDSGPSKRRIRATAAAAVVALVGLSACTSDPGPKRVARDIIEAEAIENPDLDEQCLLDELDKFSDGELKAIDENIEAENSDRNAEGEAALAAFELSLARCI